MVLANEVMNAVHQVNPKVKFVLDAYAGTTYAPEDYVTWFGQNITLAVEYNFDYVAIMSYQHGLAKVYNMTMDEACLFMKNMTEAAVSMTGDASKVIMKIQAYDFDTLEVLSEEEIRNTLEAILSTGYLDVGIGYFAHRPDLPFETIREAWSVDVTIPTISIVSPENKTYRVNDVPLIFTVNESTSWIGYSLNGQMNITVSGNTTLVGLPDGVHTITVYANDTMGNMGSSDTVYFTIDSNPPSITNLSRVPEGDVEPNQQVVVSANITDETSQVDTAVLSYTTNNGVSWNNITMIYNFTTGLYEATIVGQPAGTNVKYKIIAYDTAGNFNVNDNAEQYYVYTVIPEFPHALILPLFMIATLLAVILLKKCARIAM